jgi:hypothetical protein
VSVGLTIREQFESLHIYLDSTDPTPPLVRFKRPSDTDWFAAQPLVYDARNPANTAYALYDAHNGTETPLTMFASTPGRHRGVIVHLRPNTAYDVEVLQGSTLWRGAGVVTRNYKRSKTSLELGAVYGDVTVTRALEIDNGAPANNVYRYTVTRAGAAAVRGRVRRAVRRRPRDVHRRRGHGRRQARDVRARRRKVRGGLRALPVSARRPTARAGSSTAPRGARAS